MIIMVPGHRQSEKITVTHAARNFADVVNRVFYRGVCFVLTKGGRPVAELGPLAMGGSLTAVGLSERLEAAPHLAPGDADAFGADLDAARGLFAPARERDAWD